MCYNRGSHPGAQVNQTVGPVEGFTVYLTGKSSPTEVFNGLVKLCSAVCCVSNFLVFYVAHRC